MYIPYRSCSVVLILIIVNLFASQAFGQLSQTARFEEKFKYSDGVFTLIPLRDEGLMLIRDKEKFEGGKKLWEVIALGTDLKEKKRITFKVENRNRLIGYDFGPEEIYLLFRQGENEKSDLELVEIKWSSDETPHYLIKPELPLRLTHFSKIGTSFALGGYVSKEPSIILYNRETNSMKALPGFFQGDTELIDLRVNENNTFNVVLIDRSLRADRKVSFQTYDERGNLLLEDKVSIDGKLVLQTGITSLLHREDLMLLGTWGEGNSKQSNGFYALPVAPFKEQKIQFVAFGELNHYLDYQKENRAKRIQKNTKEVIKQGGIPNYVNYVMPYRLMEYTNGFLLFAEVYNPSSSSNFQSPYGNNYYNPYYSPYGWYYPGFGRLYSRPYSYGYNSRSSDEIKTYASVLISFDATGKVQWDYSIDLDGLKKSTLDQVADFHLHRDKITFLYKKEFELKAKTILLDKDESEEITEKIKPTYPEDEIRSDRDGEGGVSYWFGNTFYVWGYQTLRNNTMEDKVRDVFYINRIDMQ